MRNEITSSKETTKDLPIHTNNHEIRHFFHHFWNMLDFPKMHENSETEPKIEINNKKEAIVVSAEMPGIAEKDIDVQISSDGYLTISGEKRQHNEEHTENQYFSEMYYGKISRTVPLPWDLNYDQAKAEYDDGILNISIPKTLIEKQKVKKISVKKNSK